MNCPLLKRSYLLFYDGQAGEAWMNQPDPVVHFLGILIKSNQNIHGCQSATIFGLKQVLWSMRLDVLPTSIKKCAKRLPRHKTDMLVVNRQSLHFNLLYSACYRQSQALISANWYGWPTDVELGQRMFGLEHQTNPDRVLTLFPSSRTELIWRFPFT